MELLIIENKQQKLIQFFIGILAIVAGLTGFIANIKSPSPLNYLLLISYIFIGVFSMVNGFGISKTWFQVSETELTFKLPANLKPAIVKIDEIEKIVFSKSQILIACKTRKPIVVKMHYFERSQREKIFKYFDNFSTDNNVRLEYMK